MSNENEHRGDEGLALKEAKPKLKEPSMYKVFLLNDDYTPMEFVVTLLEKLFGMDREKATRTMLMVHSQGKGICGVYTYEIAETKVAQVNEYAQRHQHPLMCSMEAT
jgi:ATP-dependent Clp protease adaptor protein ClpS